MRIQTISNTIAIIILAISIIIMKFQVAEQIALACK